MSNASAVSNAGSGHSSLAFLGHWALGIGHLPTAVWFRNRVALKECHDGRGESSTRPDGEVPVPARQGADQRERRMWAQVPASNFDEVFRAVTGEFGFSILCTITGWTKARRSPRLHLARESGMMLNLRVSCPREKPVLQTVADRFPRPTPTNGNGGSPGHAGPGPDRGTATSSGRMAGRTISLRKTGSPPTRERSGEVKGA